MLALCKRLLPFQSILTLWMMKYTSFFTVKEAALSTNYPIRFRSILNLFDMICLAVIYYYINLSMSFSLSLYRVLLPKKIHLYGIKWPPPSSPNKLHVLPICYSITFWKAMCVEIYLPREIKTIAIYTNITTWKLLRAMSLWLR